MGKLVDDYLTIHSAERALPYIRQNLLTWVDVSLQLNKFLKNSTNPHEGVTALIQVVDTYVETLAEATATKIKDGHFH